MQIFRLTFYGLYIYTQSLSAPKGVGAIVSKTAVDIVNCINKRPSTNKYRIEDRYVSKLYRSINKLGH